MPISPCNSNIKSFKNANSNECPVQKWISGTKSGTDFSQSPISTEWNLHLVDFGLYDDTESCVEEHGEDGGDEGEGGDGSRHGDGEGDAEAHVDEVASRDDGHGEVGKDEELGVIQ